MTPQNTANYTRFKKKSCYVFKTDDEINVNKMEAKQVFLFHARLKVPLKNLNNVKEGKINSRIVF